ncbi:MAG: pilus assembly protein [Actinobacteria bacterium]|nr:pilus assembly protein [Actinomycetota bacterium]MBV8960176.1 pilus assembly protein [Actinomycetota bacterium]MBV9253670.1 pilus assembly protein [Actinomycetota bacterium]MBV9933372.1 pilus assembly protein [Actinomycetota bacterium]
MSRIFRAKRRGRGERGTAVVEAAILTPVVFTLLFGLLEFGWSMHSKLSISNMALSGARTATTQGDDPYTDYNVLQSVAKASGGMPRSEIQYIVVYRASGPTDHVPSSCAAGTSSAAGSTAVGSCNVYTAASINLGTSSFGGGSTAVDRYWSPLSRDAKATSPTNTNGPDYVGVYVKVFHKNITRLFGSGYTFTDDTILRIEAQEFQ